MNLMTKTKKPEQAPMTGADIAARIEELKAAARENDRLQYGLADASVQDAKTEAEYDKCVADGFAIQKEIDRLQAALIGRDIREKQVAASGRASVRRERFAEFEHAVTARRKALSDLAAGIEAATVAYAKFIAASDQMELLLPIGTSLPMQTSQTIEVACGGPPMPCGPAIAVAAEMHRVAAGPRLALPGAKAPNAQTIDLPRAIEPLADAAVRQAEGIIVHVRGQIERAEAAERIAA